MFKFTAEDFRRTATATLGALLLSATCVVAAVGPARAVPTIAASQPVA
jgi:hypothetical protein